MHTKCLTSLYHPERKVRMKLNDGVGHRDDSKRRTENPRRWTFAFCICWHWNMLMTSSKTLRSATVMRQSRWLIRLQILVKSDPWRPLIYRLYGSLVPVSQQIFSKLSADSIPFSFRPLTFHRPNFLVFLLSMFSLYCVLGIV